METVASPGRTLALLREKGLIPRKSRGQNFLVDSNIVRKIAAVAELNPYDIVVEIGPGLGALTQELAYRGGLVIAVEIDRDLLEVLRENLRDKGNVRLVAGDALKVNFDELVAGFLENAGGRLPTYKLVANLPYYITTPILMRLLTGKFRINLLVLMVQAEVGGRMLASPGSKEYGALSIAVQYYTEAAAVLKVPRTVFYPRPEVDSVVVKMRPRTTPPVQVDNEDFFFRVVRAAFNQRRKTLLNSLGGLGWERDLVLKAMTDAGIDPRRRGETLSIEEFARLSNALQRRVERR
ncbi:16S rRNA (adenine(1518)-N(6)/adenine(1519)-N(6))-dimethyltransferase RsmA [Neomoorella humiferrea]|uniref:16S rRNA (adenine(1518)-N(6)/adenine(1519)-N(6))- dimethyltransferase RsmA n=1 Tax=Neomoorella humiferrea TaxID=676965 RepID=UPI003D8DD8DB